jgi:hypothetical protein
MNDFLQLVEISITVCMYLTVELSSPKKPRIKRRSFFPIIQSRVVTEAVFQRQDVTLCHKLGLALRLSNRPLNSYYVVNAEGKNLGSLSLLLSPPLRLG